MFDDEYIIWKMSNTDKMVKRKRLPHEREIDLAFISRCLKDKDDISAIITKLVSIRPYAITANQIKKDYAEIESRWVDAFIKGKTLTDLKAMELAKVSALEKEAWDAWDISKTPGQVEKFDVLSGMPGKDKSVTAIKRDGDPKFLELMLKYSEHRCKILGLFAPIKIDADVESNLKSQDELDGFRKAYTETLLSQQRALPKLRNITPDTKQIADENKSQ